MKGKKRYSLILQVAALFLVGDDKAFMKKGTQKFTSGDKIEFLFDYYDEKGNLIKTETYGKAIRVSRQEPDFEF